MERGEEIISDKIVKKDDCSTKFYDTILFKMLVK